MTQQKFQIDQTFIKLWGISKAIGTMVKMLDKKYAQRYTRYRQ